MPRLCTPLGGRAALVKDRQLTDWRLRIEDLASEIESAASGIEDLSAQSELEAVADRLSNLECELENFQAERLG